jgi:hypothetical protein
MDARLKILWWEGESEFLFNAIFISGYWHCPLGHFLSFGVHGGGGGGREARLVARLVSW